MTATDDANALVAKLRELGSCAVAFSAGVDSAVVAKGAHLALGERAVAVTGVGPALAAGELEEARAVAAQIGVRHVEAPTDEIANPLYVANATDRCYHCKQTLYTHVRRVADELDLAWIANGANADDLGDHRPGMRAASEHRVASPLVELGLGKERVRALARHWGLPVWDKPAAPCLASRLAYGVAVTPERLARVDAAERGLKALLPEVRELRVRLLDGEVARIEVPPEWVGRLAEEGTRREVLAALRGLGFKAVTLDLAGFRSGSLNELVPTESLRAALGR
ncbi:MAG: ATP-dependent sacrificial sulfur transferase LarE [Lacipirellulaceae bacterium]